MREAQNEYVILNYICRKEVRYEYVYFMDKKFQLKKYIKELKKKWERKFFIPEQWTFKPQCIYITVSFILALASSWCLYVSPLHSFYNFFSLILLAKKKTKSGEIEFLRYIHTFFLFWLFTFFYSLTPHKVKFCDIWIMLSFVQFYEKNMFFMLQLLLNFPTICLLNCCSIDH